MMQKTPQNSADSFRRYLLNLDDQEFALTWRDALEKGDITDEERTIFREVSDERSRTHDARYELQARHDLAQFMGRSHAEH